MNCYDHIQLFIGEMADEVKSTLERRTPVKTGNAQRSYTSEVNTDSFEITNTVDYIVRLEEGWSDQAPAGMNRITLDDSQAIADRVIQKLP